MRGVMKMFLFGILAVMAFSLAQAQGMREMRLDQKTARIVSEIGTVFVKTPDDKNIRVDMKMDGKNQTGADFESDDLIVGINNKPVKTLEDFDKQYGEAKVGSSITFEVERGGKKTTVVFKKPKPAPKSNKPMIIQRTR